MTTISSKEDWTILAVDDAPINLDILRETLEPEGYDLGIATTGEEALEIIPSLSPDLILLDIMMPGIGGYETCRRLKNNEATKDIPVIFITTKSETEDIVKGFKSGGVDYILKPFQKEEVCARVETHLELLDLRQSLEKENQRINELLEKTLNGSIGLLVEILSQFDGERFGKAASLKKMIQYLAKKLKIKDSWELETVGMLSQIGYVVIPPQIISKSREGKKLSPEEKAIVTSFPEAGASLLSHIPNLKQVSKIILYQNKRFDGGGFPRDEVEGKNIPLGARLFKILWDLVQLESDGTPREKAMGWLRKKTGWYDTDVMGKIFELLLAQEKEREAKESFKRVTLAEMQPGDVLEKDLKSVVADKVYFEAGESISFANLALLENYAKISWMGVQEPIYIQNRVN
jgi:response regulator RpfG family c-di-GMP phosphodiesterase